MKIQTIIGKEKEAIGNIKKTTSGHWNECLFLESIKLGGKNG